MDTVLIKNMKIPSNCDNCKLRTFDLIRGMFCPLIDESVTNLQYAKERHPKCLLFIGPVLPDDSCEGEVI